MPRVTIGIPVYNGANYLCQAIESILGQTYGDFELLISDNASDDRTEEICRAAADIDPRVRYGRQPRNLGAARNFNALVERAQGEYFKWAAHDDVLEPTFVEKCVQALDSDPEAVLAMTRTIIIDEHGRPQRNYTNPLDTDAAYRSDSRCVRFREMIRGVHSCFEVFGLVRTEALRTTGLIGAFTSSDRVLLAELALRGKTVDVPEELFLSRNHERRSVRMRVHERAQWFDTRRKGRLAMPYWRLQAEFAKAALRAHPGLRDTAATGWYVLGSTVSRSRLLRGDLIRALRSAFDWGGIPPKEERISPR